MIDFNFLAQYCQAEALSNKLLPTDESIWRYFCRTYSKLFNTPLHQVMEMEPLHVILNVYEEEFDEVKVEDNIENILDVIYSLEDPEYAKEKREEVKQFIKEAEEEEEERLRLGKPIHKALADEVSLKNTIPEKASKPEKILPTGGMINLSYLEKEETGDGFDE